LFWARQASLAVRPPRPGRRAGGRESYKSGSPDGTLRRLIGTHPAAAAQLFLITAGEGWVAGPDGEQVPVSAGWGVRWAAGEAHTSGSATGFTALALEGSSLAVFAPEPGA
jgi:hypothetical protein